MIFRLVFFHFYCYYRHDDRRSGGIPWLTSFCLAASSFTMIITGVTGCVLHWFFNIHLSLNAILFLFVLQYPIFAWMLVYKKKYKSIFNEFHNSRWDTYVFKFVSWSTPVIGVALIGLYKYVSQYY